MTGRSRFAGSSTEWFLGYAVVLFVLSVVALASGAYALAGACLAVAAFMTFGAWRAWKRR